MNAFGLTFSLNSFIDFRNFLSFHFYSFQPNGPLIKILINSRASRGDITIGYGDLLRNSDKQWLSGFSRNLASVISAYNSDQNLKCFFSYKYDQREYLSSGTTRYFCRPLSCVLYKCNKSESAR
jgi:hypothetical protein